MIVSPFLIMRNEPVPWKSICLKLALATACLQASGSLQTISVMTVFFGALCVPAWKTKSAVWPNF